MKSAPWIVLSSLFLASLPAATQACGGHRGRCMGHHHRRAVTSVAYCPAPVMAASAQPTMSYATPQMAQAIPTASVAPVVAAAPAGVAAVQPTYEYAASTNGQPAYYYTYDSSGKMIVAQWMDWVFRGGRAAGEPAPPLPIIGALRNR